jgi:hypothetical protein
MNPKGQNDALFTPGDPVATPTTEPPQRETLHRYEVTVERQFIVYAPDPEIASLRALEHVGIVQKPGATEPLPAKVVEVKELPTLAEEPYPGVIDIAPSRETQK